MKLSKMKIVQIAPFEESVPPKKYGGTELVVYNLTQELIKRGHLVYLLATGDSKTNAKLIPVFQKSIRSLAMAKDLKMRDALKFIGIGKTLEIIKSLTSRVDIIHNHLGWRLLPFSKIIKIPIVTTLHGPLNVEYQRFLYQKFKNNFYVSISNNQRKHLPSLNYIDTVYNGIDINIFDFSNQKKEYLAFLARISPEKGPVQAIQIAKAAGLELKMAAKIDIVDKEFFEKKVKPLIDNKQIKFLGELNHQQKVKLLKSAKALLCPLQWEEPFGLFMTESMACGTPVIVFDRGSAREIVVNGKTGFIVKNVKEAIKAVKKIDLIKKEECRKRVEKNFSVEKMVDGYERVYYQILNKK